MFFFFVFFYFFETAGRRGKKSVWAVTWRSCDTFELVSVRVLRSSLMGGMGWDGNTSFNEGSFDG